jgi:phenylacetate-CoA ligase
MQPAETSDDDWRSLPEPARDDLQARIAKLLRDVGTCVPFYAGAWSRAGLDAATLRDPSLSSRAVQVFRELPVITKASMKAIDPGALLDRRADTGKLRTETTTGSSGQPFAVKIDAATLWRRRRRTLQGLWAAGCRPGQRVVWLRHLQDLRSAWLHRLLGVQHIDINLEEKAVVAQYHGGRRDVVYGQYSALMTLATGLRASGKPRPHPPRIVIGFGEQASLATRRTIADQLGTAATDFYGLCELGLIALRKAGEPAYRMLGGDLLLEYLPSEVPGFERLVATGLGGGAMPFVRYDTGDLVRRDHGAPGRPVVEIAGRSMDFIVIGDGRRVAPYRIDGLFDEIRELQQYRIVQQADGSIDVAFVTPDTSVERVDVAMRSALTQLCGTDITLRFQRHAELDVRGLAKLRVITSLVGKSGTVP